MPFKRPAGSKESDYVQLRDDIIHVWNKTQEGLEDMKLYLEKEIPEIVVTKLTVGVGGIEIDPSATISWGQVTGAPPFVAESELANYVTDSHLTTVLGQDYMVTGRIYANQIGAGQITGVTLQTTPSALGGNLNLNAQNIQFKKSGIIKMSLGFDDNDTNAGMYFASGAMISELNFGGQGNGVWVVSNESIVLSCSTIKFSNTPTVGGNPVLTTSSPIVAKFA